MDLWKRITDSRVLSALKRVDRERFVPENVRQFASENRPLPIGFHQTISQPFIVAFMTQALSLTGGERVLEIGTGSGFQTAVLAELGVSVFSVERIPELHARASHALTLCGYQNMHLLCGDGYQGWASEAPFDAILVTAAPSSLPHALVEQLAEGGRLVIPLADRQARSAGEILMRFTKRERSVIQMEV